MMPLTFHRHRVDPLQLIPTATMPLITIKQELVTQLRLIVLVRRWYHVVVVGILHLEQFLIVAVRSIGGAVHLVVFGAG